MANHINKGTRVIFEDDGYEFATGVLHRYGGYSASGGSGPTLYRSFTEQVYVLKDGEEFPVGLPYAAVRKDTPANRRKMTEKLLRCKTYRQQVLQEKGLEESK